MNETSLVASGQRTAGAPEPACDAPPEQTVLLGAVPPADLRDELPAGSRLAEFEILDVIGQGGFGIVYLAQDHALQRRVALKEYLPAALARRGPGASVVARSPRHADRFATGLASFVNEARLLASFDHPALVRVHRFWQARGTAYIAMPFLDGESLKAWRLRQGEPPGEARLRALLTPLLEAIELIHGAGCLHRDIAPDNIMLVGDGQPVLLDFGAARRTVGEMTQTLTAILKPGYAPLEQYAELPGTRQGPWTDIYALGALLHFLVIGQTPPAAVARAVQDGYQLLARRGLNGYSAALLEGMDRCLALRAEERPPSIAALRALLDSSETATATPAPPPTSPGGHAAAAPTARHLRWPHWAGLAAVAALAAGILLFSSPATVARPEPEPAASAQPADSRTTVPAAPASTTPDATATEIPPASPSPRPTDGLPTANEPSPARQARTEADMPPRSSGANRLATKPSSQARCTELLNHSALGATLTRAQRQELISSCR